MRRWVSALAACLRRKPPMVSPAAAARQKADLCHPSMRGRPQGWGRLTEAEAAAFRVIRDGERAASGERAAREETRGNGEH
jgi:hypothetical protein